MHDVPEPRRVLLAEDNPVSQRVAKAMLANLGFQADVVADGAEAVKAAARTPYRAILMDCQIPVLDGYQTTGQIRLRGANRRTPIIAVTASSKGSDRQRCLDAGMDDYVPKPLSLSTLAEVLARWAPDASAILNGEVEPGEGEPEVAESRPVLDAKVIGRLESLGKAVGEDLLGQLSVLFLADADAGVAVLREALAGEDAEVLARTAHTLCGASANLGASELSRTCAALETSGVAGDLSSAGVLLDALEAELSRVRSALGSAVPTP